PHIGRTGLIIRVKDLRWCERHPADGQRAAERERHAPARTADKSDERGRVDRSHALFTGMPAPAAIITCPSAVMERCEAPRRVIDPGPTPWLYEGPMTVTIRRPVGRNPGRIPDRPA